MARTAKKSFSSGVAEADVATLPIEEVIEETPRPVVNVTHREVRTWEEKKTIEDIEDGDFDDSEEETEADSIKLPDDPIARVVNEIATSRSTWTLQVNRLQNYERDNRTDPKSRRHCGILSIPDADYLKEERYLEDLQAKFARGQSGNWFYLCVRRDNRNHSYLPPVCVEPPLPEMMAAKAAEASGNGTVNVYTPSAPVVDGFKQFITQAKQFAELRDLLLPAGFQTAQPLPVANPEPLTDETALLHILNREGDVVDKVASKLKGLLRGDSGSDEKGPWDAVVALLTSPTLPQTVQMIAAQFRQPTAENVPPGTPPQHQQPPPDAVAQQRLLAALTANLRANGEADAAVTAIDGFLLLFPEHTANINGFLNGETQQLLGMLVQFFPPAAEAVNLPHAAEWVERLKTAYFNDGGEAPNDSQ